MKGKVMKLTSVKCECEKKKSKCELMEGFSKGNMPLFIRDMNLILIPKDNSIIIFSQFLIICD